MKNQKEKGGSIDERLKIGIETMESFSDLGSGPLSRESSTVKSQSRPHGHLVPDFWCPSTKVVIIELDIAKLLWRRFS